jgi:hypothetical protein
VTALLSVSATLVLAAVLAAGGRGRRILALALTPVVLVLPFALGSGAPFLRLSVAMIAFWGTVRVIDLCREQPARSWGIRVWHIFAIFDTRWTSRVPRRFDRGRFARAGIHALLGALGLVAVAFAFRLGYAHTAARWLGGLMFIYGIAGALGELIPAVYLLGGIFVPTVHDLPIASRTLAEFWGQRWNRVVGTWLRSTFFQPLARRGRAGLGVLAAFLASAALHAYIAHAAGGAAVAIPMAAFFLLQGVLLLVEQQLGVGRWPPGQARAWFLVAMAASLPLFLEPLIAIVLPSAP